MNWQSLLFSAQGRINRARYWIVGISAGVGFSVLCGVLAIPMVVTANPNNSLSSVGVLCAVLMGVLNLAVVYVSVVLGIKRFHDRDKSGWWMLLMLVPFGSFWIFIECGFLPGTDGPNRFGPDPLAFGGKVADVFGAPQGATVLR